MKNATFDQLPRHTQYAWALGLASRVMGREQVIRIGKQVMPLIVDRVGHGDVDPADNYWGGVWQVYVAD